MSFLSRYIQTTSAYLYGWRGLVLLISIIFIFLPMKAPLRSVSPADIEKQLVDQGQEIIHLGKSDVFMIAVGGDINLLGRPLAVEDLNSPESLILLEDATKKQLKPYRLVKRIGIYFATYLEQPECNLVLELSSELKSKTLNCRDIRDNQIAFFEFDSPIPPRIYHAKIIWQKMKGENLAVYARKGLDSNYWIIPYQTGAYLSTYSMVRDLFKYSPFKALSFCFLTFLLLALAFQAGHKKFSLVALCLLTYATTIPLAPEFSGHDETAHLSMFRKAVTKIDEFDGAFNEKAKAAILESDFYRINEAQQLPSGQCPHFVLGNSSCGISEKPMLLYESYAKTMNFLSINFDDTPMNYIWIARVINFVLLILLIATLWFLTSSSTFQALPIAFLLCGAFLGQISSITNDVPMFLYGFFLLGCGVHFLKGEPKGQSIILYIIAISFVFYAFQIDRSAVVAIPVLIGLTIFICLNLVRRQESGSKSSTNFGFLAFTCFLLLSSSLGFKLRSILLSQEIDVVLILQPFISDIGMLVNLERFDFLDALKSVAIYGKGFSGSFIWGHTYFPLSYRIAVAIMFLYLLYKGIGVITRRYKRSESLGILFTLAALISLQLIAAFSAVLHSISFETVGFESFLKTRLTAPGIASILFLPTLGFSSIIQKKSSQQLVYYAISLWCLCLSLYLLPKVFLSDLY